MSKAVAKAQKSSPIVQLSQFFEKRKEQLASVVHDTLNPERVTKIALAAISKNPQLLQCSMDSLYLAVREGATLGFEPGGTLGHYYLVPRRVKGQYQAVGQLGYKGLCELAYRHPKVRSIQARNVYRGETFDYDRGTGTIVHPFAFENPRDEDEYIGSYCIVELDNGARITDVMSKVEIMAHRDRFAASSKGPWSTDFVAMARKTVLRRVLQSGEVPMSMDLREAVAAEVAQEKEVVKPVAANWVDAPVQEAAQTRSDEAADMLSDAPADDLTALDGVEDRLTEVARAKGRDADFVAAVACDVLGKKIGPGALHDLLPDERERIASELEVLD